MTRTTPNIAMLERSLPKLKRGLWAEGMHTLGKEQSQLYSIVKGGRVGSVASSWTRCPVGNRKCTEMALVELCAEHPHKGHEKLHVELCPLGVREKGACPWEERS